MPTVDKPGVVGWLVLILGVAGLGLLCAGVGTSHWMIVPGEGSAVKAKDKLYLKTNMTFDQLETIWPQHQAAFDQMAVSRATTMQGLQALQTQLATAMANQATPNPNAAANAAPTAVQQLQAQLQATVDGLTVISTSMAKLQALNATRTAVPEMDELTLRAGLLTMCSKRNNETVCGGPKMFHSKELDEICEDDYVNPNPSVPTKETILNKTSFCNENGMTRVMKLFLILAIVAFVVIGLSLVPIGLLAVITIKPAPRSGVFNGILIAVFFLICGAAALAIPLVVQFNIIGKYLNSGMVGTKTGLSWILTLVSGCCYLVAALGSVLIRPVTLVTPA